MLSRLFQRSHHVRRLRANPLAVILDEFADYLLRPGYTAGFVHQLVRVLLGILDHVVMVAVVDHLHHHPRLPGKARGGHLRRRQQ